MRFCDWKRAAIIRMLPLGTVEAETPAQGVESVSGIGKYQPPPHGMDLFHCEEFKFGAPPQPEERPEVCVSSAIRPSRKGRVDWRLPSKLYRGGEWQPGMGPLTAEASVS